MIRYYSILLLVLLCQSYLLAQPKDEFLHSLYDQLHDSPMQQKFKQIAPMPFGVVFLPWAGCTEEDMRHHFRMMKELGFTNLKQTMGTPEWPEKEVLRIALEEGIIPFWYGEGGWEPITPELLKKLGIPKNTPIEKVRRDARMLEYQKKVLYRHLEAWKTKRVEYPGKVYFHEADSWLRAEDVKPFKEWVRSRYKTIEELSKAWNQYEVGITNRPYQSWEDFEKDPLVKKFLVWMKSFLRQGMSMDRYVIYCGLKLI